ncbi:hypothetical protein [uncultured Mediterranean phage]|nr:hypothetical protein [uncultured Mediterranean phage]
MNKQIKNYIDSACVETLKAMHKEITKELNTISFDEQTKKQYQYEQWYIEQKIKAVA